MTPEEAASKKEGLVADAVAYNISRANEISMAVIKGIEKWLKETYDLFNISDSGVETSAFTIQVDDLTRENILKRVNSIELRKLILDALRDSGQLDSMLSRILATADKIDAINSNMHKYLNDIELDLTQFLPERQRMINDLMTYLNPASFADPLFKRCLVIVSNSVLLDRTLRETREELYKAIKKTTTGRATLLSRDGLYGYDGMINDKIRQEYNLDGFKYVGSLVDDSREHCIKWVNRQILTKEFLEEEIDRLHRQGDPDGFRPETKWENFAQYRGGWNCRHQAIPIRINKNRPNR